MNLFDFDFSLQRRTLDQVTSDWRDITILAHLDIDGMCASALLRKVFKDKKIKVIPSNYEDFSRKRHFDNLIILDIEVKAESFSKTLAKRVVVIDHHSINVLPAVLINPKQIYPGLYLPSSGHVFAMYKDTIKEDDWKAAVGIISDAGGNIWNDFIEEVSKKYGLEIGKDPFYFDSNLGQITKQLNAIITLLGRRGSELVYRKLYSYKNPFDALNDESAKRYYNKSEKIFEAIQQDFDKSKNIMGNLIVYNINSKWKRFSSTFSTKVALGETGKVFALYFGISKDLYRFNIRSSIDEIDLRNFISKNSDIIVMGGGHKKAVGITIKKENLITFINRLADYVNGQTKPSGS